ncbi:unnamed protein product [Acanthoscelides obtectus]|uniref:DUF5641 domain-containing protein n=1 Tax=Acanthoscelides obtectus TaxID=200917 RepID=A0A9P0QC00_ACAOB|nr:unnamed protein product [Acanthoscelides obtectus]CAK1681707.1 hypothetical protein AOBTE_LOCUS33233 [Acanthoscelides obtectus]
MAQSVLIRKRGTIKAKLAHFEKFLNSVQPQDLDRQTIIHMQERCTKFETLFDSFDEIQSEIECESDNPEACYAEREDFETKFYLQLSRAKCLLESQSNLSNNIPHNNDDTKSQQSESDTQSISEQSVYTQVSVTQVDEINDTHNESNEVKVGATQCTLVAAQNALLATAQVDVTDKITSMVPDNNIPIQHFNLPVNIKLADPEFNVTRNIDILIGADVFWQILESERINISKDLPILQNTKLGWVLAGPLSMPVTKTHCHLSVTDPLQNQLRKFWELEEIPFDSPAWSPEERLCEKHFIENLQVLENGRFMVSLPFKESPDKLGHSRELLDRLHSHFWTRWSKEYISELQQRCRWKQTRGDLQIEQLVLMKDDNAPPAKWRLGRVIQLSPGTDGVPRVASLKTENGMTSRAINRLVPLPVVHPQDSQGPGHVCATPLAKWVSTISRRSAPPSSAQPTTADRKTVEF